MTQPNSNNQKLIAHVLHPDGKNAVLFHTSTYKDNNYVDIRIFYKGTDGKYFPTRKGISFHISLLSQMITALEQVEADSMVLVPETGTNP